MRIRTAITYHGKHSRSSVLLLEVLVRELLTIDRFSTSSISTREVTTLDHEVRDDTMEFAALEV